MDGCFSLKKEKAAVRWSGINGGFSENLEPTV
jgi:hypothetical protein